MILVFPRYLFNQLLMHYSRVWQHKDVHNRISCKQVEVGKITMFNHRVAYTYDFIRLWHIDYRKGRCMIVDLTSSESTVGIPNDIQLKTSMYQPGHGKHWW